MLVTYVERDSLAPVKTITCVFLSLARDKSESFLSFIHRNFIESLSFKHSFRAWALASLSSFIASALLGQLPTVRAWRRTPKQISVEHCGTWTFGPQLETKMALMWLGGIVLKEIWARRVLLESSINDGGGSIRRQDFGKYAPAECNAKIY